jgi:hypothetical protein
MLMKEEKKNLEKIFHKKLIKCFIIPHFSSLSYRSTNPTSAYAHDAACASHLTSTPSTSSLGFNSPRLNLSFEIALVQSSCHVTLKHKGEPVHSWDTVSRSPAYSG